MRFLKLRSPKKLTAEELEKAIKFDIKAIANKYDTGTYEYMMAFEVFLTEVCADFNDEYNRRLMEQIS